MTLCSPWATLNDLAACNCPDADGPVMETALEAASEILYAATGRQYPGTCEATLRPCSAPGGGTVPFNWSYPWFPVRQGGQWLNLGPCGCHMATDCACRIYPRVNLGRDDIQTIEEVVIDGEVLDEDSYRLDRNRYLVRTDGSHWPCCQDLGLDAGEVGTWSIDLTYGFPVPQMLVSAAAAYATELVKSCIDDDSCRLPTGTQSIVKQGVSIELSDPLLAGWQSLPEVKDAVEAANPNGITRQALVRSPEVRGAGLWS